MSKVFNEDTMNQENLFQLSDYVYFYGYDDCKYNSQKDIKNNKPKLKSKNKKRSGVKDKVTDEVKDEIKGVMILEEPKHGDSIILGSNTLFYTLTYLLEEEEPEVVNDILDTFISIKQDLTTN